MFYLCGISISFFLGALLWFKKRKSLADKVLASWLLVVGLHLLQYYLHISNQLYSYPWLLGFALPFPLLHGPFLFFYVCALTGQRGSQLYRKLLHFLPALFEFVYLIPFSLRPAQEKIFVFENRGAGYETFNNIQRIAIPVSGIIYVLLSLLVLRTHRKNILRQFSDIEKVNLDWLRYLVYSIALIWVFVLMRNDSLVFSSAVIFVIFIGYWGINQVGIFDQKNVLLPAEISPETKEEDPVTEQSFSEDKPDGVIQKRKYSRSGLSEQAALDLHRELVKMMAVEKPFKDGNLTLADLARRLNTVPNYLSQVINEKEEKSFYDYINTLRVEEFKTLLADPAGQKYSLLGLALECGFNSKSSFNKYFKKVTGFAPSDYPKATYEAKAS